MSQQIVQARSSCWSNWVHSPASARIAQWAEPAPYLTSQVAAHLLAQTSGQGRGFRSRGVLALCEIKMKRGERQLRSMGTSGAQVIMIIPRGNHDYPIITPRGNHDYPLITPRGNHDYPRGNHDWPLGVIMITRAPEVPSLPRKCLRKEVCSVHVICWRGCALTLTKTQPPMHRAGLNQIIGEGEVPIHCLAH